MSKQEKDKEKNVIYLEVPNEDKDDTITIPLIEIFKQLKKYFLTWLILAVVVAGMAAAFAGVFKSDETSIVSAMVGFNYDGIESGLDPNGNEFDANSMKCTEVVESALTELGYKDSMVSTVRDSITISGVTPEDAIDKLTAYNSIFQEGGTSALQSVEDMLNVSYYPTEYTLNLDYSEADMSRKEGAAFLNQLIESYREYFMAKYGYNEAFGSALTNIDYDDYDYAQTIDVFSNTIDSLLDYLNTLEKKDTSNFRSNSTGYTFSDLSSSVATLRDTDLSTLSSYVLAKNVTKDKDQLITYYQYQVDQLERNKKTADEKLATIEDAIKNYQKDSVVIMSADGNQTPITQSSTEYDSLIEQRTATQSQSSTYQRKIDDYTQRLTNLKKNTNSTDADIEKVDSTIQSIADRLNTLIDAVNTTASEYYDEAAFANAYSVLAMASGSGSSFISNLVSCMMTPLLVGEALLFVVYLVFAVIRGFIVAYRRDKRIATEETAKEMAEKKAEATD